VNLYYHTSKLGSMRNSSADYVLLIYAYSKCTVLIFAIRRVTKMKRIHTNILIAVC
jgi:hypothetical protein